MKEFVICGFLHYLYVQYMATSVHKQSSGRPLCVKGAGAVGDWGIVKSALSLIIYEQSLRVLLRKTHLPLHKGGFRFDYTSHR